MNHLVHRLFLKEVEVLSFLYLFVINLHDHVLIVILSLYRVAGTGAYDTVRPLAYQDAKVFMLCFRVSDPDSLDNAVSKVIQSSPLFYS